MTIRGLQFAALLLTGLALIAPGAHLFSLPNKIHMTREAYFTAQAIYSGWAILGAALILAILADGLLAIVSRAQDAPFLFAGIAAALLAATLVIFFIWVFPANQATANWTTMTADWDTLRTQWEYGHAANAILTLLAFGSVCLSVLTWD